MRLVRVNHPIHQFDAVDRLLNDFFNQDVNKDRYNKNELTCSPATNVYETEGAVEIEMSIPGFDKEQVKISVENGYLHVKGEVKEAEEKSSLYAHEEFKQQGFEKKFKLSDKIDDEKISASFKNGILKLTVQKKKEAVPQKREIEIA